MAIEMDSNKYLSDDEIKELRASLKVGSLRDRVMLGLLMNLGMRGAELREVLVSDVSLSQNTIHVVGKKNSNSRLCPIPKELREDLLCLIESKNENDRLFNLSASGLKFIWNKFRPCSKGVHSLRHTFAVTLYKKTRDIKLVQIFLGHRSIANTMVYADHVYSVEQMQKALIGSLYHG